VRAAWPAAKPLFVRLSCIDGEQSGWSIEDTVVLSRELSPTVPISLIALRGASAHLLLHAWHRAFRDFRSHLRSRFAHERMCPPWQSG
jgi:2,4-dienoyl-CoA reductase-like NADH-dependent reductase (Old Yellow Enzyme family)